MSDFFLQGSVTHSVDADNEIIIIDDTHSGSDVEKLVIEKPHFFGSIVPQSLKEEIKSLQLQNEVQDDGEKKRKLQFIDNVIETFCMSDESLLYQPYWHEGNRRVKMASDMNVTETAEVSGADSSPEEEKKSERNSVLMTNFEITGGCDPLYGCDDPTLPTEADLGLFETKDAQNKSMIQRRKEETIEISALPNVFGSISCPSPADSPDDSLRWHSRNKSHSASQNNQHSSNNDEVRKHDSSNLERYGWWCEGSEEEKKPTDSSPDSMTFPPLAEQKYVGNPSEITNLSPSPSSLQKMNMPLSLLHPATKTAKFLPHISDRCPTHRYVQIETQGVGFPVGGDIEPFFCTLAIYHVTSSSSSSTGKTLPSSNIAATDNMSNNPTSSNPIKNWMKPSSTATTSTSASTSPSNAQTDVKQTSSTIRCGRITEALSFDIVSDPEIESLFTSSLYPYINSDAENKERLKNTRCGVFPLPSSYLITNLYAVIIVRKVLSSSDNSVATDPYLGSSFIQEIDYQNENNSDASNDLNKLRSQAQHNSQMYGPFLTPFAFGVAPLKHFIARHSSQKQQHTHNHDVSIKTPISRAMQIPLFSYKASGGERPIIDHIVSLYQSNSASVDASSISNSMDRSPSTATKGGLAMLVMRYFGYLGLHSVINRNYKLPRDRLVDYTCDRQVVRKIENKVDEEENEMFEKNFFTHSSYHATTWHDMFLYQPTHNGGRGIVDNMGFEFGDNGTNNSEYVQELASIPLSINSSTSFSSLRVTNNIKSLNPTSNTSNAQRDLPPNAKHQPKNTHVIQSQMLGNDLEPLPYTYFTNELIIHLRMLHLSTINKLNSNLVVKFELRHCVYDEILSAHVAIPLSHSVIHNPRRGAFLLESVFSSVLQTQQNDEISINPCFMDEFKVKLPMLLDSSQCLFFTLYQINVKRESKAIKATKHCEQSSTPVNKMRNRVANTIKYRSKRNIMESNSNTSSRNMDTSTDDLIIEQSTNLDFVSCGFLPLSNNASGNSTSSSPLLSNDLHDVALKYNATGIDVYQQTKANSNSKSNLMTFTQLEETLAAYAKISQDSLILEPISSLNNKKTSTLVGVTNTIMAPLMEIPGFGSSDSKDSNLSSNTNHNLDPLLPTSNTSRKPLGNTGFLLPPSSTTDIISKASSKSSDDAEIILQIRTISLSSVHTQNDALCEFFNRTSEFPCTLPSFTQEKKNELSKIFMNIEIPLIETLNGVLPSYCVYPQVSCMYEIELIKILSTITKPSCVPPHEIVSHLFRIVNQLWRLMIVGATGEASIEYANPASVIPLRLNAFTTFLIIVNLATTCQMRSGVTQLDGHAKWDLQAMGKLIVLVFDEDKLVQTSQVEDIDDEIDIIRSESIEEVFDDETISFPLIVEEDDEDTLPAENHRHRRSRSTASSDAFSDFLGENPMSKTSMSDDNDASLPSTNKRSDIEADKQLFEVQSADQFRQFLSLASVDDDDDFPISNETNTSTSDFLETKSKKIDSKFDFQNALNRFSSSDDSSSIILSSSNEDANTNIKNGKNVALAMIHSFSSEGSLSGIGRRKFMTAPTASFGLSTIQEEDEEKDDLIMRKSAFLDAINENDASTDVPYELVKNLKSSTDDMDMEVPKITDPFLKNIHSDVYNKDEEILQLALEEKEEFTNEIKSTDLTIASTNSSESSATKSSNADNSLDTEIIHKSRKRPKQMRIPKKKQPEDSPEEYVTIDSNMIHDNESNDSSMIGKEDALETNNEDKTTAVIDIKPVGEEIQISDTADDEKSNVTTQTDDMIEAAGTAFLDVIGKNLGFNLGTKDMGGEERGVGFAHHRKTRSHCSIDWTVPPIDILTPKQFFLEKTGNENDFENSQFGNFSETILSYAHENSATSFQNSDLDGLTGLDSSVVLAPGTMGEELPNASFDFRRNIKECTEHSSYIKSDFALARKQMKEEHGSYKELLQLRGFSDRVLSINHRWFPFVYEIIIFQWLLLLNQQAKSSSSSRKRDTEESNSKSNEQRPAFVTKCLHDSASKVKGITIGCTPILFEMIRKSLGYRIHRMKKSSKFQKLFERLMEENDVKSPSTPLISLDSNVFDALEKLITIVTDACIDSRNFDTRTFRQSSIDVNDSIVRFLRDMFAFIDLESAHRLTMVYFSRFLTKEGKFWQDRDSRLGIRVSWEVCKLRLNSITLFVRFNDFVRVNSPVMETWNSWALTAPSRNTRAFFSEALEEIEKLCLSNLPEADGPVLSNVEVPKYKPHWLVELVTSILLAATEHAEQLIQHRASSLLFELFSSQSQAGKIFGNSSLIASMHLPFITKLLSRMNYLSTLSPKSQLRRDILPCAILIFQSAPIGLLRAYWRKLLQKSIGMGKKSKFSIFSASYDNVSGYEQTTSFGTSNTEYELEHPSILDIYRLLNLSIKTHEYEGSDDEVNDDVGVHINEPQSSWKQEFLICNSPFPESETSDSKRPSTSSSRKWFSHDAAIVIIKTSRYIVNEAIFLLSPSVDHSSNITSFAINGTSNSSGAYSNKKNFIAEHLNCMSLSEESLSNLVAQHLPRHSKILEEPLGFSVADIIVFSRAATSLYLNTLSLRQSDIVIVKTLTATVECLKLFGIKIFLVSIGETLQHWLRVILFHCGARRATVRVQALEFLALLLRLSWECYGSFSRIRIPLLAIQTEVMERLIALAATRHYQEYRRLGMPVDFLTNDAAEAILAPLWRTLDRLHHQIASQNIAFRSAIMRLAEAMKKLYRAYIASHALAYASRKKLERNDFNLSIPTSSMHKLKMRLNRIVSASSGSSKQFLAAEPGRDSVIHEEAVEDAFLAAADVFSSTELPSHRIAWLRKLADFYEFSPHKFAEEATCRFNIFKTLRQSALLYDSIWSSSPFLPWTNESNDGTHRDIQTGILGDLFDSDFHDLEDIYNDDNFDHSKVNNDGRQIEKNSFLRRMFYRVANSVRIRTGDFEFSGNKNLFYGVTSASEYKFYTPWITLREIEAEMIEEVETAGELYLKANIVESSRAAWNLAAQFYSESYNYQRLTYVYNKLALVVASQIPPVDTTNPFELSSPLGRFYRVFFHGGAPDELVGNEFVYRAATKVRLEEFGKRLVDMLKSILPEHTPIDLVLDEIGRTEEPKPKRKKRIGGPQIEPVKIKITPLRPMIRQEGIYRGSLEWFYKHIEHTGFVPPTSAQTIIDQNSSSQRENGIPHHRTGRMNGSDSSRYTAAISYATFSSFASSNSSKFVQNALSGQNITGTFANMGTGGANNTPFKESLMGVDRFSFTQPIERDRHNINPDWLKDSDANFAEKSLRVITLQVEKCFPACVTRQPVINRSVFNQSPLEAGVEAVCSWCASLYRTVIATNGQAVLGTTGDQGIGKGAAKVVADSIHCSRVKEIVILFLKTPFTEPDLKNADYTGTVNFRFPRLTEEEVYRNQTKLARGVVIFMELLHILLVRNRDTLLSLVQARRNLESKTRGSSTSSYMHRSAAEKSFSGRKAMNRTDAAVAVQSELQRSFVSLARIICPLISNTLQNETPQWLKRASYDSYFSSGTYRQTRISMGEELYYGENNNQNNKAIAETENRESPRLTPHHGTSSFIGEGPNLSSDGSISIRTSNSNVSSALSFQNSASRERSFTLPASQRPMTGYDYKDISKPSDHNKSSSF